MKYILSGIFFILCSCSQGTYPSNQLKIEDEILKSLYSHHDLPFLGEYTVKVIQGNGGFSHTKERGQYYAWDFVHRNEHGDITGVPIVASTRGKIRMKRDNSVNNCEEERCAGWANYIVVEHLDDQDNSTGIESLYLHNKKPDDIEKEVFGLEQKVGDIVEKGEIIALVGHTGWSTEAHLHYQVQEVQEEDDDWFGESLDAPFNQLIKLKKGDLVSTKFVSDLPPLVDYMQEIRAALEKKSGQSIDYLGELKWDCHKSDLEKNQVWTCEDSGKIAYRCVAGHAFSKECVCSDRKASVANCLTLEVKL